MKTQRLMGALLATCGTAAAVYVPAISFIPVFGLLLFIEAVVKLGAAE